MHGIITIGQNDFNKVCGYRRLKNDFGPQRKTLGSILRGYKSAVTTYARVNNIEFQWQSSS